MMNLHLKILDGENNHHMAEALFKSFGRALDMAVQKEPRIEAPGRQKEVCKGEIDPNGCKL